MGTALKVGLGIFIGGILLIGACGALIVAGTSTDTGGEDTAVDDSGSGGSGGSGGSSGSDKKRRPQKTRRFSGNGSKNIGNLKVTDDAVFDWTHDPDGEPVLRL